MTYIRTAEGWLNLAVILDLFARRIVSWSMQASMTRQLVTNALMMALWHRGKPDRVMHHSDSQKAVQGTQCTSEDFQKLLADNGIKRFPLGDAALACPATNEPLRQRLGQR